MLNQWIAHTGFNDFISEQELKELLVSNDPMVRFVRLISKLETKKASLGLNLLTRELKSALGKKRYSMTELPTGATNNSCKMFYRIKAGGL